MAGYPAGKFGTQLVNTGFDAEVLRPGHDEPRKAAWVDCREGGQIHVDVKR